MIQFSLFKNIHLHILRVRGFIILKLNHLRQYKPYKNNSTLQNIVDKNNIQAEIQLYKNIIIQNYKMGVRIQIQITIK